MRIRKKFLQLTKYTVPYGTESFYMEKFLPKGIQKDEHGNYYLTIGEDFTTMFTCHLDTACKYQKQVKHVFDGKMIRTDGNTILGADDKAGMVVLLYMIEKQVPGLYYFFIGEEVGCIGSSELSLDFNWKNINKIISFDRRGTNSVITDQFFGECCSFEFASSLADALNSTGNGLTLDLDGTGIMTDSAQFMEIIPECTNISVGYYDEHTVSESQDIEHLVRLCKSVVMIDWESLPVVRDPKESYSYMFSHKKYDDLSIGDLDLSDLDLSDLDLFEDEWSDHNFTYIQEEGVTKKVYVSKTWLEKEKIIISDMLSYNGCTTTKVIWDGNSCYYDEGHSKYNFVGNRGDLIDIIQDLGFIPYDHLKYKLSGDTIRNGMYAISIYAQ